jgi:hypothetical protein
MLKSCSSPSERGSVDILFVSGSGDLRIGPYLPSTSLALKMTNGIYTETAEQLRQTTRQSITWEAETKHLYIVMNQNFIHEEINSRSIWGGGG